MKAPVVVDATCLIGLERIGRLDLLPALFEPVFLPLAVAGEFRRVEPWFRVEAPGDLALVAALLAAVDAGEAEALALASEKALPLASDDRQARIAAVRLGVRVLGTLGILAPGQARRADSRGETTAGRALGPGLLR